jgi:hypothetical protein
MHDRFEQTVSYNVYSCLVNTILTIPGTAGLVNAIRDVLP